MSKFNSKAERVRFAIRKKYIVDEDWTNAEIAEELNVSEEVVSRYLNQTPQAEQVQKARNALEEEEWKQLVTDLKARIDKLAELERQLWNVVEPAVTAYDFVPVDAEIDDFHLQDGGNSVALELDEEDREEVEVEVPVPEQWQEIPSFSRLRSVWDERRRTEEQLANLLGLEADETVNVEGSITERKVFSVEDDYPDSTPHAHGESPDEVESDSDHAHEEANGSQGGQEESSSNGPQEGNAQSTPSESNDDIEGHGSQSPSQSIAETESEGSDPDPTPTGEEEDDG